MFRCGTHFDLMVALQDSRGTRPVRSYMFNQLPTKCVCVTDSLLATQLMLMITLDSQWLLCVFSLLCWSVHKRYHIDKLVLQEKKILSKNIALKSDRSRFKR